MKEIDLLEGSIFDLKNIYKRYEKEFAKEERKDYQHLVMLMNRGKYKLLLAKDRVKDIIIGYALVYKIEGVNALWLDYLAVFSEYRNEGYGTLMLKGIAQYRPDEINGLFMEVEIPDGEDKQCRKDQVRRILFYERLGAKRLDVDYQLPTPDGGFPMYLYFYPSHDVRLLPGEKIKEAIISAFEYIHRDIPERNDIMKSFLKKPADEHFS
jgi:GNAT superfamily N-acetyltransferase